MWSWLDGCLLSLISRPRWLVEVLACIAAASSWVSGMRYGSCAALLGILFYMGGSTDLERFDTDAATCQVAVISGREIPMLLLQRIPNSSENSRGRICLTFSNEPLPELS